MANDREESSSESLEDSDLDAEGEEADEEYEVFTAAPVLATAKAIDQKLDSDVDAEGEDEDEDLDAEGSTDHGEPDDVDVDSEGTSEPEENASWQQDSDEEGDDADEKVADSTLCMYCGETEEHDPSDDYEEYLECSRCNNNAHRQCARDNGTLDSDSNASDWLCGKCLESTTTNGTLANTGASAASAIVSQAESIGSATSEVLPDGSRSLRKRRHIDTGLPVRERRKRRKRDVEEDLSLLDMEGDADGGAAARPVRLRRPKHQDRPMVDIISSEGFSLILAFSLNRYKMQKILASRPRKNRWREKMKRKIQVTAVEEPEPAHYPALPPGYGNSFFDMSERDLEEKKPYGGILTDADADTSKTFPQSADRKRFEDARLKAEEDWKKKMAATNNAPDLSKPLAKTSGPPSKIKCINFGGYEIDTWNAAPYPEEYSRNKILYICEFCLKYMNSDYVAWRHKLKCPAQHPPGDEIYRDGKYSFFEVDGRKNPVYCQNLCLLAKLFLGSKTLYYDVEPFLFYVMTENDELGCHFVGYFSKEKRPSSMNNVSCILVLPIYQRRGFGHMLIEFSYLLTKKEEKTGSPEKPLSDMGLVSYRGYWRLIMCYVLVNQKSPMSISDISKKTGMTPDDVVSALEGLRALVRDPVTKTYALRLDTPFFKEYIDKYEKKNYPRINPEALIWTKYLMNRGMVQLYEGGGALPTVAPREEEQPEDIEDAKMDAEDALMHEAEQVNGYEAEMVVDSTEGVQVNGHVENTAMDVERPTTPTRDDEVTTNQPYIDGVTNANGTSTSIPASRFEIFPPFPGLYSRRRGRPPGSGRRPNTGLRSTSEALAGTNEALANGSPSLRRSRSGLGEAITANGVHDDDNEGDDDDYMGEQEEPSPIANDDQATNGAVEEEEEEEEEDDSDAEGEDE